MATVEEKIETVRSRFVSGNLLAVLWIVAGAFACWLVNPLLGWVYLGFSAFSVYIIVRRLLCSSCYYCKSCTKGLAKMSILLLGANKIPGISKGSIAGMITFIYVILAFIPSLLLANSLLQEFSVVKVVALAVVLSFLALTIVLRVVIGSQTLWKP